LKRHWLNGLLAAGLAFGLQGSVGYASDEVHDHVLPPGNWRWWHILWFQKDGNPRYGGGLAGMSRQHAPRLMPRPPLCQPEYGYYQPCWRQLPVTPRCYTCEVIPEDYAVPGGEPVLPPMVPPVPTPAVPAPGIVPPPPRPELAEGLPVTTAAFETPVPENFGFSSPLPNSIQRRGAAGQVTPASARIPAPPGKSRDAGLSGTFE
jgi:hypothetical protein